MRARRLAYLVVLVSCFVAFAAPAAQAASVGFNVSPMVVTVESKPGAKSSYDLTLTNTDDKAATFTFSKIDIQGDADDPAATPVLLAGKRASSISGYDWLDVPATTTVPANGSRKVTVNVNVPSDASGGHYAALVIWSPSRSVGQLNAQSRMAIPFLMNAGGTPPPEIKVTDIKEFVGGGTKVVYENHGKTAVKPKPRIRYIDPLTHKPVGTSTGGTCSMALPGGSGTCTITGDGRQSARHNSALGSSGGYVELVTDEGTRARAELPTEWASTWSSMLLPLAGLVLAVLYFVFLRRRRRADEEDTGLEDDVAFS